MNKLNNQSGFSAVEAILILVIVAIVGGTGFYVYHAQQNTNKNYTSDNSTTPKFKKKVAPAKTSAPVFATLPAGWTEYKSDGDGLRFGYPKEFGTLAGTPLTTTDYRDDSLNLQGRLTVVISPKEGFSTSAAKYGATIKPSPDGKTWIVSEENSAASDGYKVGDTYKTKNLTVNGGTAIDTTVFDEDCMSPRYLLTLKNSYAVVSLPELCPVSTTGQIEPVSAANKAATTRRSPAS